MSAAVLRSKSVTVVGLGNIGSQLCDLIARMADVGRITLIDKDSYEPWNLTSQQLFRSEVGKPKVAVQCRRLKQIRPDLAIEPIHNDVRYVPLGKLRADVVCTCLDSRIARQHVNEAVWRLGTPWWIDAGVRADGMLVRVNLYSPAYGGPCLECGWGPQDYELIEQVYPCGQGRRTSPTDGPASLEELVAALQAIECRKDTGIFPTDAPASLGALAAALQ
ncbi:MAG: ThiF family adenylyltransferase, partial [Armatimonadota bacterium]